MDDNDYFRLGFQRNKVTFFNSNSREEGNLEQTEGSVETLETRISKWKHNTAVQSGEPGKSTGLFKNSELSLRKRSLRKQKTPLLLAKAFAESK
jgi:hypothetical protein